MLWICAWQTSGIHTVVDESRDPHVAAKHRPGGTEDWLRTSWQGAPCPWGQDLLLSPSPVAAERWVGR